MSPGLRLAIAVGLACAAAFGAAFALAGNGKEDPVTPPEAQVTKAAAQPVAFKMGAAPAVRALTAVGKLPGLKERPEPEVVQPTDVVDPIGPTDPVDPVDPVEPVDPIINDPNPPPDNPDPIDPDPGD
jgi:outer membrane biosynthesis protein TonB